MDLHSSKDRGRTMSPTSNASRGQAGPLGRCLQQNFLRAGVRKLTSLCNPWAQLFSTSLRPWQPMLLRLQHDSWRPARHPAQAPAPALTSAPAEASAAVVVAADVRWHASAAVQFAHIGQCFSTSECASAQALASKRPERWCCPAHVIQSLHGATMPVCSHSVWQSDELRPSGVPRVEVVSVVLVVVVLAGAAVLADVPAVTVVVGQPTP